MSSPAEESAPPLTVLDRSDGEVQIRIDRIVKDSRISGQVTGLAPGERDKYKTLVYVLTDRWYIHPVSGQGLGQSWARIEEGGGWSIPSVRRQYAAKQVAALVVLRDLAEPATADDLRELPAIAWVVVKGTGDV